MKDSKRFSTMSMRERSEVKEAIFWEEPGTTIDLAPLPEDGLAPPPEEGSLEETILSAGEAVLHALGIDVHTPVEASPLSKRAEYALRTELEGENTESSADPVKKINPKHRVMMLLYSFGMSTADVARTMGMSVSRCSVLRHTDYFEMGLRKIQERITEEVSSSLAVSAVDALDTVRNVMLNGKDDKSRLQAALWILSQTGGRNVKKIEKTYDFGEIIQRAMAKSTVEAGHRVRADGELDRRTRIGKSILAPEVPEEGVLDVAEGLLAGEGYGMDGANSSLNSSPHSREDEE